MRPGWTAPGWFAVGAVAVLIGLSVAAGVVAAIGFGVRGRRRA
ncbi:hypothetical protein [Actinoplanes sp. G11-F43]